MLAPSVVKELMTEREQSEVGTGPRGYNEGRHARGQEGGGWFPVPVISEGLIRVDDLF